MDSNSSTIPNQSDVISYEIKPKEELLQQSDPLDLKIKDEELSRIIDKSVEDSKTFYKSKLNLFERRKQNEMYLFGRQIKDKENKKELKDWENRTNDNALYEIEASVKPLAMSKLPDMIVLPGQDTPESKQSAQDVSKIVNDDLKKRENRKTLGLAFKHLPVYFTGIIKVRWNPEIGDGGDYQFEVVHPDNVIADHTCQTNNADDMRFITQYIPMTIQEVIMRFPSKKDDLIKVLRSEGSISNEGDLNYKDMASEIKISETWFTWYKKSGSNELITESNISEPETKWERIEGVVWKYGKVVLNKIKNPNFDYEGESKYFTYDEGGKRELKSEELMALAMTGTLPEGVSKEQIYRNYFSVPRKPYFFMGYDQWGKIPYDETSRIEQNIRNQEFLDKVQKQIADKLANRGKEVFSKDSGIKAEDLEKMDTRDPNQNFLIDGKVSEVHTHISPDPVTQQEFSSISETRQRMYAISGSSAVRGQLQSDVATTNQIAREADFTRADDLVEDTINAASEWMCSWALQMIKLRYTKEHFRKLIGNRGEVTFTKLNRDMIEDGMEIKIKSSSSDKLRAQNNAIRMAGMKMIDPISFFEDMDLSSPVERAKRLMMFNTDPNTYMATYLMELPGTENQANALMAMTPPANPETPAQANPQLPTPTNTAQVPTAPAETVQASPV